MFRVKGDAPRAPGGRGQALAEFALILPVLMLIFTGILQFGLVFSSHIGLVNSTREGARYGATFSTDGSDSSTTATAVTCYTLGFTSAARASCAINGVTQAGTLGRAMPAYNKNNVCIAGDANCSGQYTTVNYCYIADPSAGTTQTYSLRLNVTVVYRHPLIIPLIGAIVDGLDGVPDNALRVSTGEQFRVEGPALTSAPATTGSVTGACP